MNYTLNIQSNTWNKESNLLYDYESMDFTATEIKVSDSGYLMKNNKKLYFTKEFDRVCEYVSYIRYKDDEYNLIIDEDFEKKENKPIKTIDEKLWLVVKKTVYTGDVGYRLREGDVIKLGKVMFKVKELKSEEKQLVKTMKTFKPLQKEKSNVLGPQVEMGIIPVKKKRGPTPICRICLTDENESDNPLINPCCCIGSVRFIHLLCIRQWLKSKITTKIFNFLTVHSFKNNFECELCKTAIPERLKYRSEILSLIDYQKPDTNYIMLESISREKRETKYFYIIHMNEKNLIKLGRSNDSDVRMTDISVSRNHAFLKLIKGDFFLEDNSSKFGTLTQIQNDLIIIPNKQIALQSGKLYLILSLQKTCFAWFRCYANRKLINMDYNEYFESKSPISFQDEIENLQVVNTDYTISDGYSSHQVKNSEKGESKKDMIDYDTFIYKKIEKDLKDLKADINNMEDEVEQNEHQTSINYKTANNYDNIESNENNDISGQKLVLTENSKKYDDREGSVNTGIGGGGNVENINMSKFNSEKVKRNYTYNKESINHNGIPLPIGGKSDYKSNKSSKALNNKNKYFYRNIANSSASGVNLIDKDGSNLFPTCFNEGSCFGDADNNLENKNERIYENEFENKNEKEKENEKEIILNLEDNNHLPENQNLNIHQESINCYTDFNNKIFQQHFGYNSNQTNQNPCLIEEIANLNTNEDNAFPKSTKNRKIEFFKMKTSSSYEIRDSRPDDRRQITGGSEHAEFKIIQKSKTNNLNNPNSYNNIINNQSTIIQAENQYGTNDKHENEVVKGMIDNLFRNLIHYNTNSSQENIINISKTSIQKNIDIDKKKDILTFEINSLKDVMTIDKILDDENGNEYKNKEKSDELLISSQTKNENFPPNKDFYQLKHPLDRINKSQISKRVRKMSDSSILSSRKESYTNIPAQNINFPLIENYTARKNSSSSFITYKSDKEIFTKRSKNSIHDIFDL